MPTRAVADVIETERRAILERFVERLYASWVPSDMERARAVNAASQLLDELADVLRGAGDPDATTSPSAHDHGDQRFQMGYDLATVVREYGLLHDVILDTLDRANVQASRAEARALARFMIGASAAAAEHYARARDVEVERQTSRHVAFLAHELRNPLGTARLGMQVARNAGEIRPSPTIDAIERALARLQRMIDGALLEVRLRQGLEIEPTPVALRPLVEELAADVAHELSARSLGLELEIEGQPIIDGEERLLRSALSNLVRNAIKFSHAGGRVRIEVKGARGRVAIAVTDSCGGLPEGAEKKMFDPFVQRGTDRTGFGLGLAIAHQAVAAHGGNLRVHDLPGRGCVFVMDLPERKLADEG